jgi:uncharacterized protein
MCTSTDLITPAGAVQSVFAMAWAAAAIDDAAHTGMIVGRDMAFAQTATARPRARDAPADRVSLWRTPRARSLVLLAALGAVGGLVALVARSYTDVLWFHELGLERVFLTTLEWKILARGLAGLGTACVLLADFAVVERVVRPRRPAQLMYPLVAIACGVIAMNAQPDGTWKLLLLWANRSDFGVEDPVFHRDAGFYVFSLPLYQVVVGWLLLTVVMAGAATIGAYLLAGGPRPGRRLLVTRGVRAHLLALAALLLLVVAWRMRLEQLALVLPHDGSPVPGASYTEIHVVSPELSVLALTAVGGALLCGYATVRRVRFAVFVALAVVGAVVVVGKGELAALVQRFDVQPQELARERPQIAHAIAFTQRAFDLDHVDVRSGSAPGELSVDDIRENRRTLDNVPLWDTGVLRPALNELQSIGRYYRFPRATVGRYTVDGQPRVMTIAARQLDLRRLGREERGWATDRFAYTHGYGVVAVQATGTDSERQPRFAQREFSVRQNPLGLREPRVYFGDGTGSDPPYLVVNSERGEIDEPIPGSRAPEYHYDGPGGIALSSLLRRVAFAARFRDLRLLLSETLTDRSRILLHRDVRQRLLALAPFLRWDAHPQTAVVGGRVRFIFHGYTTSDSYPYAAPVRMGGDSVNYVREGAVAAVDAFSGQVSIYAADSNDPILRAWRAAYPSLFLSATRMPPDMRAQLRYPEQLFAAQAETNATYHADDPTAFWNATDTWQRPQQLAGPVETVGEIRFPDSEERVDADERREHGVTPATWEMRPSYLFARLPGDPGERFMLATPFTPRGGQNLVAYLAGSRDDRGRPRLTLLSLPRDRLTIGPSQATRRILANPGVNQRLQLLNRESRDLGKDSVNRTVVGAPKVVPVAGALVHVQPLYLIAGGSGLPALQLVTVLVNGRVGYGRSLYEALRRAVPVRRARG